MDVWLLHLSIHPSNNCLRLLLQNRGTWISYPSSHWRPKSYHFKTFFSFTAFYRALTVGLVVSIVRFSCFALLFYTRSPPSGGARRYATPLCSKTFQILFTREIWRRLWHCIRLQTKPSDTAFSAVFRTSVNVDRKQLSWWRHIWDGFRLCRDRCPCKLWWFLGWTVVELFHSLSGRTRFAHFCAVSNNILQPTRSS